jgi:hypothetical protein
MMQTLDDKAIARLTARRTRLVQVIKDSHARILTIDAEIAFINSAPRYMRPKKAVSDAQRAARANNGSRSCAPELDENDDIEFNQELADEIARKRAATEQTRS